MGRAGSTCCRQWHLAMLCTKLHWAVLNFFNDLIDMLYVQGAAWGHDWSGQVALTAACAS